MNITIAYGQATPTRHNLTSLAGIPTPGFSATDNPLVCQYHDNAACYSIHAKEYSHLLLQLSNALTELPPSRTVALLWQPHLLTPLVLHTLVRMNIAFCPFQENQMNLLHVHRLKFSALISFLGHDQLPASLRDHFKLKSSLILPASLPEQFSIHFFISSGVSATAEEDPRGGYVYHMFTSGSTGQPKLVSVPSCSIVPNIEHLTHTFPLSRASQDVLISVAPLSFDPSIVDIFLSLTLDIPMVMLSYSDRRNATRFVEVVQSQQVTYLQCTPSFLFSLGEENIRHLLDADSPLRYLVLGGEPSPSNKRLKALRHPMNKTQVFTIYGVTEVSAWAFLGPLHDFQEDGNTRLPSIGVPMLATEWRIVEVEDSKPSSGRVLGELLLRRGDKPCAVNGITTTDFHATGDIIMLVQPDSSESLAKFYYVGRRDRQVKHRGLRVHLEILEGAVGRVPGVRHCHAELATVEDSAVLRLTVVCEESYEDQTMKSSIYTYLREQICEDSNGHLSPQYLPDDIAIEGTFSSFLDLNAHDKISVLAPRCDTSSATSVARTVWSLWCESLALQSDTEPTEECSYRQSGGGSLDAIILANRICATFGRAVSNGHLITLLMESTFNAVCDYVWTVLQDRSPAVVSRKSTSPAMSLLWRHNLGKCIDASPVLLLSSPSSGRVFIGSHSGVFACFSLPTGAELWSIRLTEGRRIETTARLTQCGQFVLVCVRFKGVGEVMCLRANDGGQVCEFAAQDVVKSRPVAYSVGGGEDVEVVYGSHDSHLYSASISRTRVLGRLRLDGWGISAALTRHPVRTNQVFAATLGGSVFLVDTSGPLRVIWRHSIAQNQHSPSPIFAPPKVCSKLMRLAVVSVTGQVNIFALHPETDDIQLLQEASCGAPCFAPMAHFNSSLFVCCHDGAVFEINLAALEDCCFLQRRCTISPPSAIAGKPWLMRSDDGEMQMWLCDVSGSLWKLEWCEGQRDHTSTASATIMHKFTKEVFSSPVIMNDVLLIGCRDNYFYALRMKVDNTN